VSAWSGAGVMDDEYDDSVGVMLREDERARHDAEVERLMGDIWFYNALAWNYLLGIGPAHFHA